jgi:hypothetical protein
VVETIVGGSETPKRVLWTADESGRFRGKKFYEKLSKQDRAKFAALFERMALRGQIRNPEQFIHEGGQIYAFKVFKRRLACFFSGSDVLITNGYTKKSTKRGRRGDTQIEIAARIRSHYQRS